MGSRDREGGVSENLRNVLSALLYQTGTQSDHYMLVLATNRPEDLDRAVTDRIDEALHFDLPRLEVTQSALNGLWCRICRILGLFVVPCPFLLQERESMLKMYFQMHILDRTAGTAAASAGDASKRSGAGSVAPTASVTGTKGLSCRRHAALPIVVDPSLQVADGLKSVAVRTEGFSGRELAKLVLKMQVQNPAKWSS